MIDLSSLTLYLLLMQRTSYPGKLPEPLRFPTSSTMFAEIKPQTVGRCPVHGDLGRGSLISVYNPDGSVVTKFCVRCLADLLKRVLPPVEEVR